MIGNDFCSFRASMMIEDISTNEILNHSLNMVHLIASWFSITYLTIIQVFFFSLYVLSLWSLHISIYKMKANTFAWFTTFTICLCLARESLISPKHSLSLKHKNQFVLITLRRELTLSNDLYSNRHEKSCNQWLWFRFTQVLKLT